MKTKLIVALGNSEKKYQDARHNIGFKVLNWIAESLDLKFKSDSKFIRRYDNCHKELEDFKIAKKEFENKRLILLKPLKNMNKNGHIVKKIVADYDINNHDILLIHDDITLNLAEFKIKYNSGHGKHKGVKDIIKFLDTKEFWRLKIGIGKPPKNIKLIDYLLNEFKANEITTIKSQKEDYKEIAKCFLEENTKQIQKYYNFLNEFK